MSPPWDEARQPASKHVTTDIAPCIIGDVGAGDLEAQAALFGAETLFEAPGGRTVGKSRGAHDGPVEPAGPNKAFLDLVIVVHGPQQQADGSVCVPEPLRRGVGADILRP